MESMLSVRDAVTRFHTPKGTFAAVRGVSFDVKPGKTLVILGESGSGKSVLLRSILNMAPPGTETSGSIRFQGEELLGMNDKESRKLRGDRIAMIFQDSLTSLDPLYRVGSQIEETIKFHGGERGAGAVAKAVQLLQKVGIPSPAERRRSFPHEMSGGMRQRAVIAMALACGPDLLLADEPTTALDVTIQAQILQLFKKVQKEFGTSIVLVTHDIGVAVEMADDIAVMYAGRFVEYGSVDQVLHHPAHPYTKGLLTATPRRGQKGRLTVIPGQPPQIDSMPAGCAFAERCPHAASSCGTTDYKLVAVADGHRAACRLAEESEALPIRA